jgi:hypothetical protein
VLGIAERRLTPTEAIRTAVDSLNYFEELQSLSLSGFRLYELPESIRKLSHLKILNADGLRLNGLPEWFGELTWNILQRLIMISGRYQIRLIILLVYAHSTSPR